MERIAYNPALRAARTSKLDEHYLSGNEIELVFTTSTTSSKRMDRGSHGTEAPLLGDKESQQQMGRELQQRGIGDTQLHGQRIRKKNSPNWESETWTNRGSGAGWDGMEIHNMYAGRQQLVPDNRPPRSRNRMKRRMKRQLHRHAKRTQ